MTALIKTPWLWPAAININYNCKQHWLFFCHQIPSLDSAFVFQPKCFSAVCEKPTSLKPSSNQQPKDLCCLQLQGFHATNWAWSWTSQLEEVVTFQTPCESQKTLETQASFLISFINDRKLTGPGSLTEFKYITLGHWNHSGHFSLLSIQQQFTSN